MCQEMLEGKIGALGGRWRLWRSQTRKMCQRLKERGDEREKECGEQSADVKERWGGETEMMVLKLDGEQGQGELVWCPPLR